MRHVLLIALLVLALLLSACRDEHVIWPPATADLSGLEPWMRPLMIEAVAWWGDTLHHKAGSSNIVTLDSIGLDAALAKSSSRDFIIQFAISLTWGDCSITDTGVDFLHAAAHEWGHIKGLAHVPGVYDESPHIMNPFAPGCWNDSGLGSGGHVLQP